MQRHCVKARMVIVEGVSMYLSSDAMTTLLGQIGAILRAPKSTFWMDIVDASIISNSTGYSAVTEFCECIATMGEPFVFGSSSPEALLREHGLTNVSRVTSASGVHSDDPLFSLYYFITSER